MKRICTFLSFIALNSFGLAGEVSTGDETLSEGSKVKLSYELDADYSYVGDAKTSLGHGRNGDVSEQSNFVSAIVTPQWNDGPLYRFGLQWQRFSFGLPGTAPLPNTLQSVNAVIGADVQLFQSWLVRVEFQPGIYSDFHDISSDDFNMPVIIGGSYIASPDLQWILGLSIDINRQWPVIPAVGVRWKFSEQWVLNLVLPSPRLEYEWSKDLTLFLGGDVKDGTFRVDEHFGDAHGRPRLNNAVVEYDEIRVGAGMEWKARPGVTVGLQGGYMPYRQFDFHRADTSFETKDGAPYGQVAISGRF